MLLKFYLDFEDLYPRGYIWSLPTTVSPATQNCPQGQELWQFSLVVIYTRGSMGTPRVALMSMVRGHYRQEATGTLQHRAVRKPL